MNKNSLSLYLFSELIIHIIFLKLCFFIFNNNEVIIKKIKDLFTEKYYYSKFDIIKLINLVKIYPIEHINASISELIEDKSNFLIDKYLRGLSPDDSQACYF